MIELTVLNDSNVELNTVDDGLIGLDVVMATGGGGEIHNQNKTVTPTESEQSVTADVGYTGLGTVTVEGIDSEYVGSDIPRNTSSSLLTEGATVIAPSGYYENSATKTVQMGTAGTPTASKGAVSNHSVSVTPSVTNQAGYIYSETKTGTAVSVSASELVSGTKSITQNGTEDVTNYASVSVSVPNSYSASDEGKVVNNGALVAQTSDTVTQNGTVDTTLINSLTVNVSGGISVDDIATGTEPSGNITITASSIVGHAFQNNKGITGVTCDSLTSIAASAFQSCTNMTSASFSNVTQIGDDSFNGCTKLVSIDVRKLVKFQTKRGFSGCSKLTTFVGGLTKLTTISDQCFYNTRVPVFVLPAITSGTGGSTCFGSNTALTTCDFGTKLSGIGGATFSGDSSFNTLIIRKATVATLSNINAFTNTPFASGGAGGTLYVPSSLISSYQSASNWSTILGYANNQIKSIESTHTDSTAPIDLTLYYADGTPIT